MTTFIKKILYLLTLPAALLSMETTFSSDEVTYENNTLRLRGHVVIENLIGTIRASSGKLVQKQLGTCKNFLSGQLEEAVTFHLAEDKTISCDQVSVDFANLKATLSSLSNPVIYQDVLHEILLKSKALDCSWEENSERQITLKDLVAKDSVEITYLNDFQVFSDRAYFYKRRHSKTPNMLHGILELMPKRAGLKCLLKHGSDEILSDKMILDTKTRTILFKNPSGRLKKTRGLDFRADRLIWRPSGNSMILSGNIQVADIALGKLFSKDRMEIAHIPKKDGSFSVDKLRTKGLVHWANNKTTLTCEGKVSYDAKTKKIAATSDKQPLKFTSHGLSIQALSAEFPTTTKLASTPLVFKNSVFIQNAALSAVADQVKASPDFNSIELSSEGENRVLLWDRKKDLCISAEKILIAKDPETGERSIQGFGRMQFRFEKEEFERLNEVIQSCLKSLS